MKTAKVVFFILRNDSLRCGIIKKINQEANMDFEKLNQLKQEMDSYRPLTKEQLDGINKHKKIEHVWSSTALEGGTLSKYETASILETGMTVHGVPVKDILETLDLGKAYDHMEELAVGEAALTADDIQDLNRLATVKTVDKIEYAGIYRLAPAYPRGVPGVSYTDYHLIHQAMDNLIWWNDEIGKTLHSVQQAAELHQRFVTIHPFPDGNGRVARLLMNTILTRNGYPIVNIQPDPESRVEYMETLAESQRTGDIEPFIQLVSEYVEKELEERIQVLQTNESNIQKSLKRLGIPDFDKGNSVTENDIEDELDGPGM